MGAGLAAALFCFPRAAGRVCLAEVLLVLSWQHVPGWLRRARWRQPGNKRSERCLLLLSTPSPAPLRSGVIPPKVFNLFPNSPPAVPRDVSVLPPGCSAEGLGSSRWHFPKCWLRSAADAAQPRFLPPASIPSQQSQLGSPVPSHPCPVIPCPCRCW